MFSCETSMLTPGTKLGLVLPIRWCSLPSHQKFAGQGSKTRWSLPAEVLAKPTSEVYLQNEGKVLLLGWADEEESLSEPDEDRL